MERSLLPEVLRRLRLPPLRPYQLELYDAPTRQLAAVSATQIGKTHAAAVWHLARRWCYPRTLGWWCAPTYALADIAFQRIRDWALAAGFVRRLRESKLIMEYQNGSSTHFKSWEQEENLGAATIHDAVVDEAHLLTRTCRAIISTRLSATLGPIRYIGNAVHTGSEWWRLCKLAQVSDGQRMTFLKWTWKDRLESLRAEGKSSDADEYEAFINEERREMPEEEFQRLYDAEFLRLGVGLLDVRAVMVNGGSEQHPVKLPFAEDWDGEPCVGGLDLGQKQDWTVLIIWGRRSGRMKCMVRVMGESWAVQIARVMRHALMFCRVEVPASSTSAGVDQVSLTVFFDLTGIGGPVREMLREASVGSAVTFRGVNFTSDNKIEMVQAIQVAAEKSSISCPFVAELASECETLERTALSTSVRYKAAKGFHDDCVWAAGLGLFGRKRIVSGQAVFS